MRGNKRGRSNRVATLLFPSLIDPFLIIAPAMKHLVSILYLATCFIATNHSAFAQAAPPTVGANETLRVMSFNIRNSNARDGSNAWPLRTKLIFEVIREFDPDLLGTQEVLSDQFDALSKELPEYAVAGVARDDGIRKGEWAAIYYRKKRFQLLDSGNFWFSQTPERPGGESWDAAIVRICSWTVLRDLSTGRELLFANTHFDHKGVVARTESARLLAKQLAGLGGERAIVLAGDFNCTEADEPYRILVNPEGSAGLRLIDSYRAVHPRIAPDEATFHGFKGTRAGSRIDWILHTPDLKAQDARIIRPATAPYPSDHYPVTAVLAPVPRQSERQE